MVVRRGGGGEVFGGWGWVRRWGCGMGRWGGVGCLGRLGGGCVVVLWSWREGGEGGVGVLGWGVVWGGGVGGWRVLGGEVCWVVGGRWWWGVGEVGRVVWCGVGFVFVGGRGGV